MTAPPHIIVIGGGLIGLSCADSLIARGARVTLIERANKVGGGAGEFNSGMIHPSQAAPWDQKVTTNDIKPIQNLANRSLELTQLRRREMGCPDVDRPRGIIQIFDSQYAGEQSLEYYQLLGVAADKYAGQFSFRRLGISLPDDQSGSASIFMAFLAQDLNKRGCSILTEKNCELRHSHSGLEIVIEGTEIKSDHIVVACGAASAPLLQTVDIDLPVQPMTGHALCFDRPGIALPQIPILHWDSRSALTVFEQELRLSGTRGEESPDALLEIWEEVAPEIIAALGKPKMRWSADRPASNLGRPIISKTKIPGLWVNSGHGHMGWSLCSASGQLMAEMILDGAEAAEFALP
ncbi:MAG: FAD-binding oxidoreductase [Hellea sp.]|nr:FAD-binding oxidoreductase [Hellea sp.]